MANIVTFGQQQARAARYWYERLVYTAGPLALGTGTTNVFTANGLNKGAPQWIAELSSVAATQAAGVAMDITFDRDRLSATAAAGFTDALRAGMREAEELYVPAVDKLALNLVNTGTPINQFNLNYYVALRRMTVADKLLRGIQQFNPDEQRALNDASIDVQGFVRKGFGPIPLAAQMERTVLNRLLKSAVYPVHASSMPYDQTVLHVSANETGPDSFLVLRSIAVEGGTACTISVDRDDDLNYMGVAGGAFQGADDAAWDVFVPATKGLTVHVQTAAPATIAMRLGIWHCRLSDLLRVRFGLFGPGDVADNTYLRAIAGVA